MIHPIKEEIYITIYLLAFGIYLVSTYDALLYVNHKLNIKKITRVIVEIIFGILQLTITYFFSYRLASGYMPIYFILFFIIGCFLYYKWLQDPFLKTMDGISKGLKKMAPYVGKGLKNLLYSPKLMGFFKKIYLWFSNLIRRVIHSFKKKEQNKEEKQPRIKRKHKKENQNSEISLETTNQ